MQMALVRLECFVNNKSVRHFVIDCYYNTN